jgi:hypothetical protein
MPIRFRSRFFGLSARAALLLCVAVLPACGGGGPEPGGPGPDEGGGGGSDPWSLDGEFAEIEAEAPGFGGYFYSGDGTLTLYVQDPATQADAARAAVARRTGGRGRSSRMPAGAAEIRVLPGRYAFSQLQAWRTALAPILLARADVVYIDVAEDGNALRIGVLVGTGPGVQARVVAEGLPGGAFAIVAAAAPVRLQHTLRDNAWEARGPGVPGGYLVQWQAGSRTGFCALGFNVHVRPIRDPESYTGGYVTASHCSDVSGRVDGTNHYQPDNPHHLGLEIRDPAFVTGGECPAGRRCRWSDAAVFTHSPGRLLDIGLLAAVSAVGSTEVAATPLQIQRKRPYPVVGELVDKVGPGSGWTFGRVYATCVDVNVAGSNIVLFCQDVMDHPASTGESGSPVYVLRAPGMVDLAGLLWGGTAEVGYFSSIRGMERELGDLEVGG